jgi:hypothetical protein
MPEPLDPPIRTPAGGWPHASLRVDLPATLAPELAFYELAGLSRRFRLGVVAGFHGVELFAYPHQTTDEIARSFLRLKLMAAGQPYAGLAVARASGARTTPEGLG